ncbi:MAG: HAMP domain-containing histidine kinase, partial [bacterium]|nr:HAMP domain-containing histidine kinase [bacterium]
YIDLGIAETEWRYVKKGRSLLGNSVGRIEDIVVNLLTFSRGHEPEYTRTDVNGLVAEAMQVAGPKAEKAHVELAFERGGLDTVFMDGRSVFRVVLNLVTNAIEACQKRGGKITVATHQDPTAIRIDVSDTGEGIPDSFRDKLFLAFSSTKGSAGTGLGLACSQKIARAHGGEITVESVLDKGSTFTLHLPIHHEDPTKQRETT